MVGERKQLYRFSEHLYIFLLVYSKTFFGQCMNYYFSIENANDININAYPPTPLT